MCMTNRNVLRKTKTPNSSGLANKCPSYAQQNPRMAPPGIEIFHRKANIEERASKTKTPTAAASQTNVHLMPSKIHVWPYWEFRYFIEKLIS
ncbi:hypothetical protein CEXT_48861, partial [Caerostris extrusa]